MKIGSAFCPEQEILPRLRRLLGSVELTCGTTSLAARRTRENRRARTMYANAARGRGIAMKQDPESLERDNDIAIDHMGDRVAMLRKITSGIHDEAESHHRLLDDIGGSMGGVGANLQQTVAHFNKVFVENKNGRQFCYMVGGIIFVVFLLRSLGLA